MNDSKIIPQKGMDLVKRMESLACYIELSQGTGGGINYLENRVISSITVCKASEGYKIVVQFPEGGNVNFYFNAMKGIPTIEETEDNIVRISQYGNLRPRDSTDYLLLKKL